MNLMSLLEVDAASPPQMEFEIESGLLSTTVLGLLN